MRIWQKRKNFKLLNNYKNVKKNKQEKTEEIEKNPIKLKTNPTNIIECANIESRI